MKLNPTIIIKRRQIKQWINRRLINVYKTQNKPWIKYKSNPKIIIERKKKGNSPKL